MHEMNEYRADEHGKLLGLNGLSIVLALVTIMFLSQTKNIRHECID